MNRVSFTPANHPGGTLRAHTQRRTRNVVVHYIHTTSGHARTHTENRTHVTGSRDLDLGEEVLALGATGHGRA